MDLNSLSGNWDVLYSGILLTMELLLAAMLSGMFLAACLTAGSFADIRLKKLIDGYIYLMRGTPMLVQFYFIYYGLAQFNWLHATFLWQLIQSPIACSVMALSLNTGAYTTVILRGAFTGIPKGELEAAKALGLSRIQVFKTITLPRAMSLILPLYSNEVLMLLKGTSLASTITVLELTGVTEQLIGETYQTIFYWLVAGALYMAISGLIIMFFKTLEYLYKPNKFK